jgi:hypothetical protein
MKLSHLFKMTFILLLASGALLAVLPNAIGAQSFGDSDRSVAPTTVTYPSVDTNQIKCYNATTEIACPSTGGLLRAGRATYRPRSELHPQRQQRVGG